MLTPAASPAIPRKYVEWAAAREVVVVAGAHQALKYRTRIRRGLGTPECPFTGTQSVEAAVALLSLTGGRRSTLYAWGYGVVSQPSREYYYQARDSLLYRIHFINDDRVANALNFSESAVRHDARKLRTAVADCRQLENTDVMFVGCSWGAAIIDYGLTRAPAGAELSGPGVALAGPLELLAIGRRSRLSENGDHGRLWVQRHPGDPIGQGGLGPLRYFLDKQRHHYSRSGVPGETPRFWGITGG